MLGILKQRLFTRGVGLLITASSVFSPASGFAAEISHQSMVGTDKEIHLIGVEGPIRASDVEEFRKLSLKYPKSIVVLGSDGGQIMPAIEIGKIIRISGHITIVPAKTTCASACALIWLAGTKKFLSPAGKVGFHAAYYDNNGKLTESGLANAFIGQYLSLLDYHTKAIAFATSAPPDKIRWLNSASKDVSGIDFQYLNLAGEQNSASPPPLVMSPQVRSNIDQPPPPITFHSKSNGVSILEESNVELDKGGHIKYYRFSYNGLNLFRYGRGTEDAETYFRDLVDNEIRENSGWVFYESTGDNSNNTSFYYINPKSINREGGVITAWIKIDYEHDRSVSHRQSKIFYRINCNMKTLQQIEEVLYDKNGKALASNAVSGYISRIVPESVGESLLDTVCR